LVFDVSGPARQSPTHLWSQILIVVAVATT
jgi:hypothetical protein